MHCGLVSTFLTSRITCTQARVVARIYLQFSHLFDDIMRQPCGAFIYIHQRFRVMSFGRFQVHQIRLSISSKHLSGYELPALFIPHANIPFSVVVPVLYIHTHTRTHTHIYIHTRTNKHIFPWECVQSVHTHAYTHMCISHTEITITITISRE